MFDQRASHIDLTAIPQRWLRNLVWGYLADMLQSQRCPRSGSVVDGIRRAAIELGAFLEVDAPGGGHDLATLGGDHMRRFVADQRRRERDGLTSLAIKQLGEKPSIVTTTTRSIVFNALRKMLRDGLETGAADGIGLAREFIVAVPTGGIWTATTATSSCSPARTCCIGGANASRGDNWPRAHPTTPPPTTCTAISNPPPAPSTA